MADTFHLSMVADTFHLSRFSRFGGCHLWDLLSPLGPLVAVTFGTFTFGTFMALCLLKAEKSRSSKGTSINTRRLVAGCKNDYLLTVLAQIPEKSGA